MKKAGLFLLAMMWAIALCAETARLDLPSDWKDSNVMFTSGGMLCISGSVKTVSAKIFDVKPGFVYEIKGDIQSDGPSRGYFVFGLEPLDGAGNPVLEKNNMMPVATKWAEPVSVWRTYIGAGYGTRENEKDVCKFPKGTKKVRVYMNANSGTKTVMNLRNLVLTEKKKKIFDEAEFAHYKLRVTQTRPEGVYKCGDKVAFTVTVEDKDGKPVIGQAFDYMFTGEGGCRRYERRGETSAKPFTLEVTATRPGNIYLSCVLLDDVGRKLRRKDSRGEMRSMWGQAGALVEPEKLRPHGDVPADFDSFWAAKLSELKKVEMKPELTLVKDAPWQGKFKTYDVKVPCVDGVPVSGYLTVPTGVEPGSCPIVVTYHGAGVFSASKDYCEGVISFNVNAHGILNGQPKAYYNDLYRKGALKDYYNRNRDDREKDYFRNMYLRVVRSLDFVKTLPEWDGKNLIVTGTSQGGMQSIVAASFVPEVSLCCATVPAMCDLRAARLGRMPGWGSQFYPSFAGKIWCPKMDKIPEYEKTSAYYDLAYHVKNIKNAQMYIAVGFCDTTCSASSIYAMFNNIPAGIKKHMAHGPHSGHEMRSPEGSQAISEILKKAKEKINAAK